MAAPRPKKTAVKKKPPVKKKPSFLKKDTPRPARDIKPGDLRSQTLANDNTPRPAKDLNKGGLRAKFLQDASKGSGVAKGLIKKIPVVGAAAGFIVDAAPAGTGSTVPGQAQKAVQKKMKREIRQGPKLAVTGVKEGIIGSTSSLRNKTGQNRPIVPTWRNKGWQDSSSSSAQIMPKASMSGGGVNKPSGKSSTSSPFSKGKGTAALPKGKTGPSNTAATSAAASSSGGTSKAAKSGVGKQTRYQRNETAMEQKRSSNRPKKSIFSLFRKG